MTPCPLCGVMHSPNCLKRALERIEKQIHDQWMGCFCCGARRADGMQTHAPDCEWCTLMQRVARIESRLLQSIDTRLELIEDFLEMKKNGSNESPDTQRSRDTFAGRLERDTREWIERAEAADRPELHPDSRPTKPAAAPDPGADAAAGGPAGTEPGF